MFTGIVEAVGRVERASKRGGGLLVRIATPAFRPGLSSGDSIAVDGACLTVTSRGPRWFEAELSPETLKRTTLGAARPGRRVNLERPLQASGRLGGHFVQGHVDATGAVASVARRGEFVEMSFRYPPALRGLLIEKGSVAIDGVSLTVASVGAAAFTVALIPHTMKATTLSERSIGDRVNLEADLLGKYVKAFLSR